MSNVAPRPTKGLFGGIKSKLGPFPVWVWGLFVGVIVVAYLYYRNNSAKAAAAANTTVSGDTLSSGLVDNTSTDPTDGLTGLDDGTSTATTPTADATNSSWEASAVAWLGSHGYSPLVAQNAIENYLSGTLDATDASAVAAVNAAVQNFGLPPEGTFAIPQVTSAATTTTTTGVGQWYLLAGVKNDYYLVTNGVRVGKSAAQYKAAGSPPVSTISAANLNKISKPGS